MEGAPQGGYPQKGQFLDQIKKNNARLAQSVERKALNLVVVGSSPTVGVYTGFNARFLHPLGRRVLLSFIFSNTQFVPVYIWALSRFPDTDAGSLGRGLETEVGEQGRLWVSCREWLWGQSRSGLVKRNSCTVATTS